MDKACYSGDLLVIYPNGFPMKHLTGLPLSFLLAGAVFAQSAGHPPVGHGAGHPAPAQAGSSHGSFRVTPDMLAPRTPPQAVELPHEGKVVSTITASGYSYVEVAATAGTEWIAGPATTLKAGDTIRYSDGPVMANFTSKSLQRTFAKITFVDHVMVVSK